MKDRLKTHIGLGRFFALPVAMLATCLVIAWAFIQPFWLGAVAALVATVTEWACGDVSRIKWLRWADDNLMIPLISCATAFEILASIGAL